MNQSWARTKGEPRIHLYDTSLGYPIRVCNWTMPDYEFIENGDAPFCKYCQAYKEGKRKVCFAPTNTKEEEDDTAG